MSSAAALCLVRDDAPPQAASIEQQLERTQRELDMVTREVDDLRRRDDTLKLYMRRLDEELRLAARLQQDFLPKSLPQVGPVRFHTLFRPAGYVSGDLYDVMRLDECHVGFYMADAVGHGMPAALLTMFLKNALATKQIIPGGYRLVAPSETMEKLNATLVAQNLSHATFATAIYGVIDTRTLELTFSRGGHPAPLLMRGEELQTLQVEGSLLGIFPEEKFSQTTVQLQPNDRLIVFSDGMEGAFTDQAGDPNPWREAISASRKLSAEAMVANFAEQLDRGGSAKLPKDDLTLVVIQIA
jgi:phosphoserine phosphatase RsbU/P